MTCEGARISPASPRRGREVAHAVLAQRYRRKQIVRCSLDTHLRMRVVDSLLRPPIRKPNVELHKIEVKRLEPVELPMKLFFRRCRDHHGVVDTLAVDSFTSVEDARASCYSSDIGLFMLDGAVGVVGDAAQLRDAVREPEAPH